MGSLSISYAKQAGYTVISTSSLHNFDLLKSHGADHVFDHRDPMSVSRIRALFPIHYWFDTISLNASLTTILKIVAPHGGPVSKTYIHMLLPMVMAGDIALPEGVTVGMHQFSTRTGKFRMGPILFVSWRLHGAGYQDWHHQRSSSTLAWWVGQSCRRDRRTA